MLARKIIDSEIWKRPPEWFKIWAYLLLRAQHAPYKGLKRGQLITSIPEIQEATCWMAGNRPCKISRNTIFNCLEWMRTQRREPSEDDATTTMITTAKTTHHILIEVSNYAVYQNPKIYEHNGEDDGGKLAATVRGQRKGDNINKNVIRMNNSHCPKTKFSDEHMDLALLLRKLITDRKADFKFNGSINKWANDIRLMIDQDKRDFTKIKTVLEWSQKDPFWQKNILSTDKLRKQFDRLEMQMQTEGTVIKPDYSSVKL